MLSQFDALKIECAQTHTVRSGTLNLDHKVCNCNQDGGP
jgi:hypothetical protein